MTTTYETPPLAQETAVGGVGTPAPRAEGPRVDGRHIAQVLQRHRHAVAAKLLDSIAAWEKYAPVIAACNGNVNAYIEREFHAQVDYLAFYFRDGDLTYRDLYLGDKIKEAYYEPESSVEQQIERRQRIAETDRAALLDLLRDDLSSEELARLDFELSEIGRLLTSRTRHTLDVLLIGDCLFLDVMAFLPGAALQDDISINPTFLTSKNAAELRNALRRWPDRKFDLIFYSPFTYEFAPEFARLLETRHATSSASHIRAMAESAMENVTATLDLLSDLFECNIFVHNTANVRRRHNASAAEPIKRLLTSRARRLGRTIVNERIAKYVAQRNAATYDHLFVLDETTLLRRHGEVELGRLFYDSDLQHPAAMGKWIAQEYRDVLAVHARLLKKKLVVCDLDNTLWKGVIGEGAPVEHFAERQQILKRLQAKGVVLAINSKNDPKKVHWTGAVLCADDFVCAQINWDNKVGNLKRISHILNLKTKDFVFVDDRADEREMVSVAMPEVQTLDPTDERTWRLLDLWSQYLSSQGETDRTQFYKQKEARESFLNQTAAVEEDQGKMFERLGITVSVRDAGKSDIKRVAELINRTNQFNTCGSRTSVREVTDWLASGQRRILVIDAGDKFGSMGTIAIAVLHVQADRVEIPIFVLSCRVFGYGIEKVVVNAVKRLARRAGVKVIAPFKETPHNEPCRKVYPENGFQWDGSQWIYGRTDEEVQDPNWLSVKFSDAALSK